MPTPTTLPVPQHAPGLEIEEFWSRAQRDVLALAFCPSCDLSIWYPRAHCPQCGGPTEWIDASGRGTIYTYTVVARGIGEYREITDYALAYVELDEGPRMMTNIVDWRPGELVVGAAVEVVFTHSDDGATLPRFRPVRSTGE